MQLSTLLTFFTPHSLRMRLSMLFRFPALHSLRMRFSTIFTFPTLHSLRMRLSTLFTFLTPHSPCRALPPALQKTPHSSGNTLSRVSQQQSPSIPHTVWQPSDNLKAEQWPEENLTSTVDEGGGFYPMRLGELLDDGRFVITRKLGWGGFSTVWLARDREYVLENTGSLSINS